MAQSLRAMPQHSREHGTRESCISSKGIHIREKAEGSQTPKPAGLLGVSCTHRPPPHSTLKVPTSSLKKNSAGLPHAPYVSLCHLAPELPPPSGLHFQTHLIIRGHRASESNIRALGSNPSSSSTSCVTLGKKSNFAVPQCHQLYSGVDNNRTNQQNCCEEDMSSS